MEDPPILQDILYLFHDTFPELEKCWEELSESRRFEFLRALSTKLENAFSYLDARGSTKDYRGNEKKTKKRRLQPNSVSKNEGIHSLLHSNLEREMWKCAMIKFPNVSRNSKQITTEWRENGDHGEVSLITLLPDPIWNIIFQYLDSDWLSALRLTCRYFHNLIQQFYPQQVPLCQLQYYLYNCSRFEWHISSIIVSKRPWDEKGRELGWLPPSTRVLKLVETQYFEEEDPTDNEEGEKHCFFSPEIFRAIPESIIELDLSTCLQNFSNYLDRLPVWLQRVTLPDVMWEKDSISVSQMLSLLKKRPNLTVEFSSNRNVLFWASTYGYQEIVSYLVLERKDLRSINSLNNGMTSLYIASYYGFTGIAKLLVEHGAMVNKGRMDSYGCTPLYTASFSGFTEIVRILLQHGADPNIPRSDDGSTPLYLASENGHEHVVRELLQHGAEVNRKCADDGFTALMTSSNENHINIVQLLLQYGADVGIKDKRGETALDKASSTKVLHLLQSYQSPLNEIKS